MSRISEKADKTLSFVYDKIDSLDLESIKTDGLTVRAGNKVLKFVLDSENMIDVEDEIRAEFRNKLADKLALIKTEVAKKISEMSEASERYKLEYEKKEHELKRRIKNAKIMPEVHFQHAQRGLSLIQGSYGKDSLTWLVQGVYWPKFLNMKPIEQKFSKRMLTNITFLIQTEGDKVTGVSTRKTIGLDYFQHYHQNNPDCWGRWKSSGRTWGSAEDIISIAKEAEAVLENINENSLANGNPRGLPRFDTIKRHVIEDAEKVNLNRQISQMATRMGIDRESLDNGDIWTV